MAKHKDNSDAEASTRRNNDADDDAVFGGTETESGPNYRSASYTA